MYVNVPYTVPLYVSKHPDMKVSADDLVYAASWMSEEVSATFEQKLL